MKKLIALSFLGTSFFLGSSPLKADWDYYGTIRESSIVVTPLLEGMAGNESQVTSIYKYNSITGNKTLLNTIQNHHHHDPQEQLIPHQTFF